jgi:hypothetical protein
MNANFCFSGHVGDAFRHGGSNGITEFDVPGFFLTDSFSTGLCDKIRLYQELL